MLGVALCIDTSRDGVLCPDDGRVLLLRVALLWGEPYFRSDFGVRYDLSRKYDEDREGE